MNFYRKYWYFRKFSWWENIDEQLKCNSKDCGVERGDYQKHVWNPDENVINQNFYDSMILTAWAWKEPKKKKIKKQKERNKEGKKKSIKINGMIWFCLAWLLQESHLNGSHYKLDSRSKDNYCCGGSHWFELCQSDQHEILNSGPRKHVSLKLRLDHSN